MDSTEESKTRIWDKVQTTDPAHTKPFNNGGYQGTSIVPQYLFKRATEMFGPAGKGWGFDLIKSELIEGHAMMSKNADPDEPPNFHGNTQVHTAQVLFWYRDGDERCEITGIGHTPFVYMTNRGPMTDFEYEKKSVTDAITKAMSLLGFGADVRMGMYEQPSYVEAIAQEKALEEETDQSVAAVAARQDFVDQLDRHIQAMKKSSSLHELAKIHASFKTKVAHKGKPEQQERFQEAYKTKLNELKPPQEEAANG